MASIGLLPAMSLAVGAVVTVAALAAAYFCAAAVLAADARDRAFDTRIARAARSRDRRLRAPGVRLVGAAQGQAGVDLARADRPDLILLDLHLPDMHGEEVLRRLWEDPLTRAIPVAVLSADATPAQARRLRAAGAAAYLTKPLDVSKVLELLDDNLSKRSS